MECDIYLEADHNPECFGSRDGFQKNYNTVDDLLNIFVGIKSESSIETLYNLFLVTPLRNITFSEYV